MSQNDQGPSSPITEEAAEDVIHRIGKLTRMLRDNMQELGLDKEIERAAEAIPDARDRLHYVATMTERRPTRRSTPLIVLSRCKISSQTAPRLSISAGLTGSRSPRSLMRPRNSSRRRVPT